MLPELLRLAPKSIQYENGFTTCCPLTRDITYSIHGLSQFGKLIPRQLIITKIFITCMTCILLYAIKSNIFIGKGLNMLQLRKVNTDNTDCINAHGM